MPESGATKKTSLTIESSNSALIRIGALKSFLLNNSELTVKKSNWLTDPSVDWSGKLLFYDKIYASVLEPYKNFTKDLVINDGFDRFCIGDKPGGFK